MENKYEDPFKDDRQDFYHENDNIGTKISRKVLVGVCAMSKKVEMLFFYKLSPLLFLFEFR